MIFLERVSRVIEFVIFEKLNEWFKNILYEYNIIKMINLEKTEWTKFYGEYRELDQFHLQKRLVHFENEYANMSNEMSPYQKTNFVRKIIKEQNGVMPKYINNLEHQKIYVEPFNLYFKTIKPQLDEVIEFYRNRKQESEKRDKERRNARAIEKVICEICNKMVSRTNLSTHRKSKKCQSII